MMTKKSTFDKNPCSPNFYSHDLQRYAIVSKPKQKKSRAKNNSTGFHKAYADITSSFISVKISFEINF